MSLQLELYEKYDYPFPETVMITGLFNERKAMFEDMVLKKQESLQNYCLKDNPSPFVIEKENTELQLCFDILETIEFVFCNTVELLDEKHWMDFVTAGKTKPFTVTSPDGEITGTIYTRYNSKKVKALQLEINKLKGELNIL